MMDEQNSKSFLYTYIYKILKQQIKQGLYPKGTFLPSQKELCQRYHLGIRPVQTAMKQLEKENYIVIDRGKLAVVVYELNHEACQQEYLQRREFIPDVYDACILLLFPIIIQVSKQLTKDDIVSLKAALHHSKEQFQKEIQKNMLFSLLFHSLNNIVLKDMYTEMSLYLQPTQIQMTGHSDDSFCHILEQSQHIYPDELLKLIDEKAWETLLSIMQHFISEEKKYILQYLNSLYIPHSLESVPYHWEINPGRQKRSGTIAVTIMEQIIQGKYLPGTFLPSFQQLSETYKVSEITIRESIAMLNELKIIQTFPRKGNYVLIYHKNTVLPNCFQSKSLKSNLILFLGALQIVALTIKDVALAAYPYLPADFSTRLQNEIIELDKYYENGVSKLLFDTLCECVSNTCVQCNYMQLKHLMIWGLYLDLDHIYRMRYKNDYQAVLDALIAEDAVLFAVRLGQLYHDFYHTIWDILAQTNLDISEFPTKLIENEPETLA